MLSSLELLSLFNLLTLSEKERYNDRYNLDAITMLAKTRQSTIANLIYNVMFLNTGVRNRLV